MKSNFVLWKDGLQYYVSKRIGSKKDNSWREQFVGFFETEKSAYKKAEKLTDALIYKLNDYKKYYRRK